MNSSLSSSSKTESSSSSSSSDDSESDDAASDKTSSQLHSTSISSNSKPTKTSAKIERDIIEDVTALIATISVIKTNAITAEKQLESIQNKLKYSKTSSNQVTKNFPSDEIQQLRNKIEAQKKLLDKVIAASYQGIDVDPSKTSYETDSLQFEE